MGRNRRKQLEVFDTRTNETVLVDSVEEVETYRWLLAAQEMGVVKDFFYQPCTFHLTDPVTYMDEKGRERCLFREHVYSPDFLILIEPNWKSLIHGFKKTTEIKGYPAIHVDVKGGFNRTARSFSIDQKIVYAKYGLYVFKLVPKDFMKKFGIPEDLRYTSKTKKPSKKFEGCPLMSDVFKV